MNKLIKRVYNSQIFRRNYHPNVIKHYENPKNVGSLNKDDKEVGTGLVGAPACIHEDTMIAVALEKKSVPVKILYLENKIIHVWSYNQKKDIYEIKIARVIKNNFKKSMKKIILDDNSYIICTPDHKFLLKNNTYLEVKNINNNVSLVPFKRMTTKRDVELCNNYNHKIKKIEDLEGEFDCYDLQVEENNNFAVITKETKNSHSGIIIKNCGDVMKLQIKVNKNGVITDSKFKTFGCGSAIASSSLATEWIKGKHINDANSLTNKDIASYLKLPPVKLHCSMLAEDAIKTAINDYKKKQK